MSVAHAVFPPASRTLREARRCRRQPLPPQRQHLESRHLLPTRIRILPRLPPAHTTLILRLDATPGLSFAALRAQLWLARRGFDGRASAPVLKTTTFCLLLVEYSLPCRCKSSRPYLRALCFRGGCTLRCAPEWTTANDSENSDSLAEKVPRRCLKQRICMLSHTFSPLPRCRLPCQPTASRRDSASSHWVLCTPQVV